MILLLVEVVFVVAVITGLVMELSDIDHMLQESSRKRERDFKRIRAKVVEEHLRKYPNSVLKERNNGTKRN